MAKRPNKQHIQKPNIPVQKPVSVEKQVSLNGPFRLNIHACIVSGIAIITWLYLKVCLQNEITLWDDTPYIKENWLVKNMSWEGLRNIFSTPSMGNYHPLTILSYAIEYSYVQLEPWLYHFDSLLLHVGVVVLVYWLVLLLTRRTVAAIVTALLFGLHPMHMESVAWVASRKDVLCGLFYMGACIGYVYYLQAGGRKWVWYAAAIILFTCSLLSKAVAVTLPLTLLLIDYWQNRPIDKKVLAEKIPYFALALIFGIVAIRVQHTAGAMGMTIVKYNPIERLALGTYAFITYLWKAVVPVHLHCLYPYPDKVKGVLPYIYYLYPALCTLLVVVIAKFGQKSKAALFGFLFFFTNIVLLLQFIPVGDAVVAERYTYIPYLGLFFIAGYYVSGFFEPGANKQYGYIALGASLVYIGVLGYLSNERCGVWHDELSLWRDETEKEPITGVRGFNNLGYIYYSKWLTTEETGDKKIYYDSASYFMNKTISMQPDFVNPYTALGEMQRTAGRYDEAKNTYFTALKRLPNEGNLYFGLAIVHYVTKNMDSAGYYFRKVLEVAPTPQAYGNYGNYLTNVGKDDSALIEFDKAISLTKDDYVPYMNRGNLHKKMKDWDGALHDYESALKINPDAGELYYLRSFCDTQKKNNNQAITDIEKSILMGYNKVDMAYYNGLKNK